MALPDAFKKNILKMKEKADKANGEEEDASVSGEDGESSSASGDDEASSDSPDMKGKPNPLKAWAAKNKK